MTPLSGEAVYRTFRARNKWADDYLPNAAEPPDGPPVYEPSFKPLQAVGEWLLGSSIGARLEGWEMTRKITRLSAQVDGSREAYFSADCCKGHMDGHGERIMREYEARVASLALASCPDPVMVNGKET